MTVQNLVFWAVRHNEVMHMDTDFSEERAVSIFRKNLLNLYTSTLKIEAKCSSKTPLPIYKTTQCHKPPPQNQTLKLLFA
jgi:hypothetical protein